MDTRDVAAVLAKPLATQLLRSEGLARLAYIGLDELPRVVPVSFLWENGQLLIFTIPASAKVEALQQHPAVAVTIDHDGLPPRALLLRGRAHIEMVEGVPEDYVRASLKTQSGRAADDFGANVRAMYQSMAVISIEMTWARLNDFETTLPKAVEEILAQQQRN